MSRAKLYVPFYLISSAIRPTSDIVARIESSALKHLRGRGIPRVRQNQNMLAAMKTTEIFRLFALLGFVHNIALTHLITRFLVHGEMAWMTAPRHDYAGPEFELF